MGYCIEKSGGIKESCRRLYRLPPYEADSCILLLTYGCTYRQCHFCNLYRNEPLTGLAGHGKGYRNAVNSVRLFSELNPYFISVDSLTLFEGTKLYLRQQEGTFIPAGEKERLEELQK